MVEDKYSLPVKLCQIRFAENTEIRIEKNNVSGHILLALLSIPLTFMLHYSCIHLNARDRRSSYHASFLSRERGRKQNFNCDANLRGMDNYARIT